MTRGFRRVVTVTGAVVALAGLAAAVWFIWVPAYRPNLRQGERYGVDVSHHQGLIDWKRVVGDDVSFAYIKATEGADHVDDRFVENWKGSGDVGIARGAYHFFTLCADGSSQARNFLRVVPREAETLPPAVDLELAGNCSQRPSRASAEQELLAFLSLVENELGQQAILYVGADFEDRYHIRVSLHRPLWERRFLLRPGVAGWVIWQASGFARIDGIRGRVDLDVIRGRTGPGKA